MKTLDFASGKNVCGARGLHGEHTGAVHANNSHGACAARARTGEKEKGTGCEGFAEAGGSKKMKGEMARGGG